jgi:hypothetical protein
LVSGDTTLGGNLELSLIDDFVPDPLNNFTILAAGDLLGQFDNVAPGNRLTTTGGNGSFVVNYGSTSPFHPDNVILSDFQSANVYPGDYDGDEYVGGNDFLLWQRADASTNGLAAWQTNYGTSAPAVSTVATVVPEPTCAVLLLVANVLSLGVRNY